ncbi:hypothetical protein MRI28_31610 [Nocardiopsis dassonvillei]|uniref:hypothetical protein n=1 Tax=Nocardiopsis dassonvillei TaxID=2014 RepID=UPI00200F9DF6|nr:hypothetical protein [Nocardiopsis dassonvillei]MCK9874116.1 hypothetical protein [Nocardiopsis dassonvillei]
MNRREYADAIAARWYDLFGPSRAEVPMGVLATAAMRQHLHLAPWSPGRDTTTDLFVVEHKRVWMRADEMWPYLSHRWGQYTECFQWPNAEQVTSAARTFAADLTAMGVLEHFTALTHGCDFLGAVLHRLLHPFGGAPPADPLRGLVISPSELDRVNRTAVFRVDGAGTGADQVLPLAVALRGQGEQVSGRQWHLRETHEFRAAVLAVNAACWGLADPRRPNVLVAVSEDPDWVEAEREEQAEAIARIYGPPGALSLPADRS